MRVLLFNESLQWSPTEPHNFASCSVDKSIAIWDTRLGRSPAASFQAHKADVNVLSWNRYYSIGFWCSINSISILYLLMLLYLIVLSRLASCMLASGSDDGTISIRDLRMLKV
jgi:ribosome assembly protein RRB1